VVAILEHLESRIGKTDRNILNGLDRDNPVMTACQTQNRLGNALQIKA